MTNFNKIFLFTVIVFVAIACQMPQPEASANTTHEETTKVVENAKLSKKEDTIAYSLGVTIAKQMQKYDIEIKNFDEKILLQAIQDVYSEKAQNLPIHPDVAKQIVNIYVRDKLITRQMNAQFENKTFLIENSQKTNVVTLPNGIQYKEISTGNGKVPSKYDNVTVSYSGRLPNGDVFVNTGTDKSVNFKISSSLSGWQEVLPKMPEGSEWEIYLPPRYAFGATGNKNVPPNSVVIYKIKLEKIN